MLFLEPTGPEREFIDAKIDLSRTDLAQRYRDNPAGPHDPDVQDMLNIVRFGVVNETLYGEGRHVILCRKPHQEWVIAEIQVDRRTDPIEVLNESPYTRLEDAEWALFKLQWKRHTGQDLPIE